MISVKVFAMFISYICKMDEYMSEQICVESSIAFNLAIQYKIVNNRTNIHNHPFPFEVFH